MSVVEFHEFGARMAAAETNFERAGGARDTLAGFLAGELASIAFHYGAYGTPDSLKPKLDVTITLLERAAVETDLLSDEELSALAAELPHLDLSRTR